MYIVSVMSDVKRSDDYIFISFRYVAISNDCVIKGAQILNIA